MTSAARRRRNVNVANILAIKKRKRIVLDTKLQIHVKSLIANSETPSLFLSRQYIKIEILHLKVIQVEINLQKKFC